MNEVIITAEGSYRTVDGRRVEIRFDGRHAYAKNLTYMEGRQRGIHPQRYNRDGSVYEQRSGEENDRIVGPWVEEEPVAASPVQEVTAKQIVPGVYGIVTVGRWLDTGKPSVAVSFGKDQTAEQLRDAARILNELADFIDA